jgi:CRISPR-associated protein Csx16
MSEAEGKKKVARLVTFLGLGRYDKDLDRYFYDPTEYEFQERKAAKTPFVCRALAELIHPSDIAVLTTEKAKALHGDALQEALRDGDCPAPRFVPIPDGQTPAQLWKQFDAIKTELRNTGGPVMLDITHGFRSQPFFAAAVTMFVRAVDKSPPDLGICYAAYDARDRETGATPIWELTEFVAVLDWSRALATFLQTGRAEDAGKATKSLGNNLRNIWFQGGKHGEEPNLKELGEALDRFGADLETIRTGDLLTGRGKAKGSALQLLEATRAASHLVEQHAPPLADVLDRVSEIVEPLAGAGGDLSGKTGREAIASLAKTYLEFGRYLEAAATVREGRINFYAPKAALCPGSPDFDAGQRHTSEERARLLNPVGVSKRNPEKEAELDLSFNNVAKPRNDLLHAQYRNDKQTQTSRSIIKSVREQVEEFERASQSAAGVCLVNLSNHPTEKWDDAQKRAALDLAERIEYIEFPAVPPDADENAIATLADDCLTKLPREATHALVQGEFTLTVELVRRLQARGVTCVAATSKRNVEEEADGRKISTFTFVRFRTYPDAGPT